MATTGGMRRRDVAIAPAGAAVRCAARALDLVFAAGLGAATYIVLFLAGVPDVIAAAPAALFGFLYFVVFEVFTGSAPGKRMFGLVIEGTGSEFHPTLMEAAIRNSFMLVALIPVVGLPLWVVAVILIGVTIHFSPEKLGIHDQLANGTQVVRV